MRANKSARRSPGGRQCVWPLSRNQSRVEDVENFCADDRPVWFMIVPAMMAITTAAMVPIQNDFQRSPMFALLFRRLGGGARSGFFLHILDPEIVVFLGPVDIDLAGADGIERPLHTE